MTMTEPPATRFPAGLRVRTTRPIGLTPYGAVGAVDDMQADELWPYDVAVRLDGRGYPTRFYAHEIEPA